MVAGRFLSALIFRMEGPSSSSLWALWTIRSRMASAKVGSPMTSCHFGQRQLAGDQGGGVLVTVFDDFHEVAALLGIEAVGSPVVEDEEVCLGEGAEQAGVAAIGASQLQFGEHPGEAFVEHREVVAAGFVAERAGEP